MGRYIGPVCRKCRREGVKLFLKGERCFSAKCALEKRNFPPGPTGRMTKKLSAYAGQLREKQKVRTLYGLFERPFRHIFKKATRKSGITGATLLILLERRLDNCLYRMGLAASRRQGRQFVRHGLIQVNGRKMDIPSYQVAPGDIITVKESARQLDPIRKALEAIKLRGVPGWLSVDSDKREGRVLCVPSRDMIDISAQEQLIVELYSK